MKQIILLFVLLAQSTYGQDYINKTYDSEGIQHVLIDNFKGDINVVTTNTKQIKIRAINYTENPMESFKLEEFIDKGVIAFYISTPCKSPITKFVPENPFAYTQTSKNCEWDDFEEDRVPDLKFTLEVPKNVNVYVATIMDGNINVDGVEGNVFASNVNGSVALNNIVKATNGTTVNGDVDVSFSKEPSVNARFSTINGDITLHVPEKASLTTKFKSYSGDFYTDLDAEQLPNSIKKKEHLASGEKIDIGSYTKAKIGSGEIEFSIETFSGNAYLKKNK